MLTKDRVKNVGLFKQRGTFQMYTEEQTPSGGTIPTWVDMFERWVNLSPISGWERRQIDQLQSEVSHIIKVRHNKDLLTNQIRFLYRDRIFNVRYPINLGEESKFIELAASELVGDEYNG